MQSSNIPKNPSKEATLFQIHHCQFATKMRDTETSILPIAPGQGQMKSINLPGHPLKTLTFNYT